MDDFLCYSICVRFKFTFLTKPLNPSEVAALKRKVKKEDLPRLKGFLVHDHDAHCSLAYFLLPNELL